MPFPLVESLVGEADQVSLNPKLECVSDRLEGPACGWRFC